MAVRKIVTAENPVLRQKAKKVHRFDNSHKKLIADMFETMEVARGAGLAAPQIGLSIRLFVAEYEGERIALFNPEIVKREGSVLGTEGCLSIPGYIGENIPRAEKITVKAQDYKGRQVRHELEGWFARIVQHEIDHLDGILYLDRLQRPEDLKELVPEEEEALEEEVAVQPE